MNAPQTLHQFADAATAQVRGLTSDDVQLIIRQPPKCGRVALGKEKDRKPIDPPPILQLKINREKDPSQAYLQSPYYFMSCTLLLPNGEPASENVNTSLAGTLVSSLHRLKDTDNTEGGFFVFGDLSVKLEGVYALKFNLYEMTVPTVSLLQSIVSEKFTVHAHKNFPGMSESTFLTRSFSDQGVRLRLRKEPRKLLRKRGPASDDYEPRHYNVSRRQPSLPDHMKDMGQSSMAGSMQNPMQSGAPDSFGRFDPSRPRSVMMSQNSPPIRPSTGNSEITYHQRSSEHSISGTSDVSEHGMKRPRLGSSPDGDPSQGQVGGFSFPQQPQSQMQQQAMNFTQDFSGRPYIYQPSPQQQQQQMYASGNFAAVSTPPAGDMRYAYNPLGLQRPRDMSHSISQTSFDPLRHAQQSPISPLGRNNRFQQSPQYPGVLGDQTTNQRQSPMYQTHQVQAHPSAQQFGPFGSMAVGIPPFANSPTPTATRASDAGSTGDWRSQH